VNYEAFQEKVLVPWQNACPPPDGTTFNQGAMLPMAVVTTWAGLYYTVGLPADAKFSAADEKGFLIWGGVSSVGSAVIQIVKIIGFRVHATAGSKHYEYLNALGASEVFDYKDKDVVEKIARAVKKDSVSLDRGYDAVGSMK
jgi:NADPH:quinone reductase-like Zn-dependent oxidoreductase